MSFQAPRGASALSLTERRAAREMLAELTSHRLEVTLAPSQHADIASRGGMVRVVLDANAAWYRRMCADHPSTRKRLNREPDTMIKRSHTIRALEEMTRSGYVTSAYQRMIVRYIPGFIKDWNAQRDEHRKAAYARKLEKRKEKRAAAFRKRHPEVPF